MNILMILVVYTVLLKSFINNVITPYLYIDQTRLPFDTFSLSVIIYAIYAYSIGIELLATCKMKQLVSRAISSW